MSLPLSPPPSRSGSQASCRKNEYTTPTTTTMTTISTTTSIFSSPMTPSSTTSLSPVSSGAGTSTLRSRLSLDPQDSSPHAQTSTFLTSPTPISTACSDLRSFFSPCSSDEEDSDDEEEMGMTPGAKEKTKGHFQRLWASREPPSTPPSCPPPPAPRRPSALGSPTFGWKQWEPEVEQEGGGGKVHSAPAVLPAENRLPARYPLPSPPLLTAEYPAADPFMASLQSILASQLQSLTPLLTTPPPELATARLERDRLLVKTQKAHFRRAPIAALQVELRAAEERVRRIERTVVGGFLGVLEGIVDGMKDGCERAMAIEDEVYKGWQGEGGLEGLPLEIVTGGGEGSAIVVQTQTSEETIIPIKQSPLPQTQVEIESTPLSPCPHRTPESPALSATTSISSSTTTSPSPGPISRGHGRLRGGTFGHETCAYESTPDHDCADEAWPCDPMTVKVGDVEMRMI